LVGVSSTSVTFQVGLNNASSDQITLTFGGLGLGTVLSAAVTSTISALDALSEVDAAIQTISTSRAGFGAAMNRLETTISSIQTMRLNYSAANARIRDVDVAEESASLSRNQVLTQAGVSVLAQANQIPQSALNLLR
jgi:flagellin